MTAPRHTITIAEKFADWVTAQVGSWRFIILQSFILMVWIVMNADAMVNFDPYPFILLNLALSFQAAFATPFIMMSQNRQAAKDRATIEEDLRLDEISEAQIIQIQREIAALSEKIDRLMAQ